MLAGDDELNALSAEIIGAAVEVHRALGPGLLESAYQKCLAFELAERGLMVEVQKPLRLLYRRVHLDCAYRLDLVVGRRIIVEVKSLERLAPIHQAQLMAYLRLTGFPLGLLFNFNSLRLVDGLRRVVNIQGGAQPGDKAAAGPDAP